MMDSIIDAAKERANREMNNKKEEPSFDRLDQIIKTQQYILQEIKEIKRQLAEMKQNNDVKEY